MRRFAFIYICLAGDFYIAFGLTDAPTLGRTDTPRLVSKDSGGFEFQVHQNHTVIFYDDSSEEMYVGGTDFVIKLDVNDSNNIKKFPLKTIGHQQYQEGENVITVIEKFQDSLLVCGTNGRKPQCWKLFSSVNNQTDEITESYDGTGISPFTYTQNSISIVVEEDLYAATPLNSDGSSLQFRRKAGITGDVWMHHKWVSEPTFISASWVKRKEDRENEKIYVFFREKNSDHSPEADPWISRVARVCKVDEGGPKRFLQNIWTSFLKARLVCGFPHESLYFNHLQDVYVVHDDHWLNTTVYALFTSSWNSTAVCIYSVEMIEEIFENSAFKGFNKEIPKPRPGTCVKNSKSLPLSTLSVVRDYPELTSWVHSTRYTAPFYISSNNYIKIAVDRVQAADKQMYNILLLATDSGKIHKIVEAGPKPFIISETQLSSNSTVQTMKLDSKKKTLVVGFSDKISIVDLQRCQDYNNSCAECVLAQDPYCAWTKFGCTPTVLGGIQNVMDGQISVCSTSEEEHRQVSRTKRETTLRTVHSVALGVPFYLSCPIDSYHAAYTWEHDGQSSPCLQMQSNCLHLIPAMSNENYGNYECISKEKDYTKVVTQYQLKQYQLTKPMIRTINYSSAVIPQIGWLTPLLAVVVLEVFS
uniref:Sema domain-containing protein n=1 Tax=Monopterus albus TaxID=43700 RepID=A0A3Q3J5P6_MONAL|nr:semaphorin-7A [Monopterus albus]